MSIRTKSGIRLGVDENTFAIYTTLKLWRPEVTAEQAGKVNAVFAQYPDYQWDQQQKGRLRRTVQGCFGPWSAPAKVIEAANTLLRLQRV